LTCERKSSSNETFLPKKTNLEDKDVICDGEAQSSVEFYKDLMLKTHYKLYLESKPPKPKCWDKLDHASKDMLHAATKGDDKRAIMVYGENESPLYVTSVDSLLDVRPLDTSTVDACLWLLSSEFRNEKMHVATETDSLQILLSEDEEAFALNMVDLRECSWLILPCLADEHWFLFVVDIDNTKVHVLDPATDNPDLNKTKVMVSKFNKFWQKKQYETGRKKTKRYIKANSMPWKFAKQQDNVNCGVYILRYTEALLRGEKIIVHFDPDQYRLTLTQKLVSNIKSQHDNSAAAHGETLLFQRFENGLLDSPEYYCSPFAFELPQRTDRIVADVGLNFHPVEATSFRNLCSREWLSDFVVDATLNAAISERMRSTFINVRSKDALSIIKRDAWDKNFVTFISINRKTLIMPVLLERHWCLIWVQIEKKAYRFFDPMHIEARCRMYFEEVLDYLTFYNRTARMKVDTHGWTIMELGESFPEQKDVINCGVFILYYIFRLLKLEGSARIDPCAYRLEIARFLLANAPNMRYLCGICARDEFWRPQDVFNQDMKDLKAQKTPTTIMRMVRCETCRRWFHHFCDNSIKDVSFSEICSETYKYVCEVCKAFTHTIDSQ